MRIAEVNRNTLETQIQVVINLDGSGKSSFDTGLPFLEHMMDQIARHGLIDMDIRASGDLQIDAHHTVEDLGITLGQAVKQALGDKRVFVDMVMLMCLLTRHCRGLSLICRVVLGSAMTFNFNERWSVVSMSIYFMSFFRDLLIMRWLRCILITSREIMRIIKLKRFLRHLAVPLGTHLK